MFDSLDLPAFGGISLRPEILGLVGVLRVGNHGHGVVGIAETDGSEGVLETQCPRGIPAEAAGDIACKTAPPELEPPLVAHGGLAAQVIQVNHDVGLPGVEFAVDLDTPVAIPANIIVARIKLGADGVVDEVVDLAV